MSNIKVRLIKPLNGQAIGSVVEYDKSHVAGLVALGAVELVTEVAPVAAKPNVKPAGKSRAKAEPAPLNKMDPAPLNKADEGAEESPAEGEIEG